MKQSNRTANSKSLYGLTTKVHWFWNYPICRLVPIIFSPEKLHIPNIFLLSQFNFLQTPIETREIQFIVVNDYSACDRIAEYGEDLYFNFPIRFIDLSESTRKFSF